jgi:hypothetical protein
LEAQGFGYHSVHFSKTQTSILKARKQDKSFGCWMANITLLSQPQKKMRENFDRFTCIPVPPDNCLAENQEFAPFLQY